MSGIFVPEIAKKQALSKYPAIFENAVTRFNLVKGPSEETIAQMKEQLAIRKARLHQEPKFEEQVWAVWGNLQRANRV